MTSPKAEHEARRTRWQQEVDALARRENGLSAGRLVTFLAILVVGIAGISQAHLPMILGGVAGIVVFIVLVIVHARVLMAKEAAEARVAVHDRHLLRLAARWGELPASGAVQSNHPYASDVDLVGSDSLAQRLDVSQTLRGEQNLSVWLGTPASISEIKARQAAVAELADNLDLREALEARGNTAKGSSKLDGAPFLAFTKRKDLVRGTALVPVIHVFPLVVLGLYIAGEQGLLPAWAWVLALVAQSIFALSFASRAVDAFQLIAARRGYAEAFQKMLVTIEEASFESERLNTLRERVHVEGRAPSSYMARLDRWAGLAEFHTQFPIHFVVNLMTLWDLHVLLRLEGWNADVGKGLGDAFEALGEIEALSSLASMLHQDPSASLPTLHEERRSFAAEALVHPLLPVETRVANDVQMPPEGAVVIITGSNMAGKSTLLRAVGLNIALAQAGGPVLAKSFDLSPVRLRASMRIDDDLKRGASYFHAELTKLRSVVADADAEPPIFFLLDELLRGTNARARHIGARAILKHLSERGASGLTATHDIALSALEDENPEHVLNVHFTDVMLDGEMVFDYRLQPGVVKTSNALQLLKMAGIEVVVDDKV